MLLEIKFHFIIFIGKFKKFTFWIRLMHCLVSIYNILLSAQWFNGYGPYTYGHWKCDNICISIKQVKKCHGVHSHLRIFCCPLSRKIGYDSTVLIPTAIKFWMNILMPIKRNSGKQTDSRKRNSAHHFYQHFTQAEIVCRQRFSLVLERLKYFCSKKSTNVVY